MINLKYSLVIEATDDPTFFGFYSPELQGFSGVGHSIEDCLYQARWGMEEHLVLLKEKELPIPTPNPNPPSVTNRTLSLMQNRSNNLTLELIGFVLEIIEWSSISKGRRSWSCVSGIDEKSTNADFCWR